MDSRSIIEFFEPVVHVAVRHMFGGHGVYADGRIVAIEAQGLIWMKADDVTTPAFELHGSRAFSYFKNGKAHTMSYWALPDAAYDDPDELRRWCRLAEDAARRAQAKGKSKRKLDQATATRLI